MKISQVSLALCRGMEVLNDVLCLRGAEAALAKHGLAEAAGGSMGWLWVVAAKCKTIEK